MSKVRTRFAPSPTGYMHIGNLRTALYAYLLTKHMGGDYILRIEDTDQERYVDGAVDLIYRTLKETGIKHDEGPDVGGEYGPYIQSERRNIYKEYAEKLVELGGAYYCFCDKERLDKLKEAQLAHKMTPKYDGCCRGLSKEEIEEKIKAGVPYVIRQKIDPHGTTSFEDAVFGKITVENSTLDDNVLLKSDGLPTYNFANVVDDHLMHITHVIRGNEYLSSTPKYNLLYQAFGWEIPTYIHVSPIIKENGKKLSKREGDASYEDFINKGYLKDAIINYIALLGWSPKNDREKFTLDEMVEMFSVEGLSKSASIFDEAKMRWLNSCYVKELSPEDYYAHALPFMEKLDYLKGYDLRYLATLLQGRTEIFSDVEKLTAFLTEFDGFDLDLFVNQKWKTDREVAKKMIPDLTELVRDDFDNLHDALVAYAEKAGYKKGQVLWVFRIAITGAAATPGGATEMATLLGKEKVAARLALTLERL